LREAAVPRVQTLIEQALDYLRRNDTAPAENLLAQALAQDPQHCDTLHLYGQMRRVQNRFAEAEDFYRRALAIEPERAELHHHLGQLLVLTGRLDEAMASLREAIRLKPHFADAHLELGLALSRLERFADAEACYREVLRLQPNLLAAKQALSATLISLKRPKEAEAIARGALAQARSDPLHFATLEHNLAIALSEQRRYDEALVWFNQAQTIAPGLPRADYNRANTLQAMGRFGDAEGAYRQAVLRDPLDLKAHHSLNQLLYRLGRKDFLESYDTAATIYPQSPVLPTEKARLLFLADRYEEACEYFGRALSLAPDDLAASSGLASTFARLKEFDKAAATFERLTNLRPDDAQLRCSFADCLLRAGDWARALEEAEAAMARDPYYQSALALWGTALRGLDDPREQDLNDYDALVRISELEPPPGFSNMADFNAAIETYLATLHLDVREHINQTSRLGTKTLGTLFGAGHDLVERLKLRIDEAVSAYIARMKSNSDHPLFARKTDGFEYWGSWSTRLKDQGFHVNHVHPRGWISSAYYVAVPDAVADDGARQGWLKFGEPPFDAGLPDAIRRAVKPVPGQLVLFPSYMWHGTVPFHSAQTRTTIAFDVVPAAK